MSWMQITLLFFPAKSCQVLPALRSATYLKKIDIRVSLESSIFYQLSPV